jgi:hypothetical protein
MSVIGGLLLGVPMLCFYHPPELPYFKKFQMRHHEEPTSVIVRSDGDSTPDDIYGTEADSTSAGKNVSKGQQQ